jgi:hypothetical protein
MLAIGSLNFLTPMFMARRGYGLGYGHLQGRFKDQIEAYLARLIGDTKVELVVPCTIYYPCEVGSGWADKLLDTLGYTKSPAKLQCLIDVCYQYFTSEIKVGEIPVSAVKLSDALDSKNAADYDNRVEPSVQGGKKMGQLFVQTLKQNLKEKF